MQYCKKCGARVRVLITDMELPLMVNQAAVYVVSNQKLVKSYMPHECYAADPAQNEAEIERLTQFFIGCRFEETFDDSFLLTVPENLNLIMSDEDFFDDDLRKQITVSTWYLLEKFKKACESLSYAKAMTRLDENVESEKSKRQLTNAREEIISALAVGFYLFCQRSGKPACRYPLSMSVYLTTSLKRVTRSSGASQS